MLLNAYIPIQVIEQCVGEQNWNEELIKSLTTELWYEDIYTCKTATHLGKNTVNIRWLETDTSVRRPWRFCRLEDASKPVEAAIS